MVSRALDRIDRDLRHTSNLSPACIERCFNSPIVQGLVFQEELGAKSLGAVRDGVNSTRSARLGLTRVD